MPVGGKGTRAVLTAHRGLPEATLFNELDKAKVGDTFSVTTFNEVYAYQVIETKVINPDDTQQILPEPERDLMTLVTCTPLGINTHRILVTAERVKPTPEGVETLALGPSQLPSFPWWALVIAGTIIAVAVYVWRDGYRIARLDQARAETPHFGKGEAHSQRRDEDFTHADTSRARADHAPAHRLKT